MGCYSLRPIENYTRYITATIYVWRKTISVNGEEVGTCLNVMTMIIRCTSDLFTASRIQRICRTRGGARSYASNHACDIRPCATQQVWTHLCYHLAIILFPASVGVLTRVASRSINWYIRASLPFYPLAKLNDDDSTRIRPIYIPYPNCAFVHQIGYQDDSHPSCM